MLTGSLYFDFEVESHRVHQLVERAIGERTSVMLTWKALAEPGRQNGGELDPVSKLLAAHEVIRDRQRQRRFRQAVFTMVHGHGDEAGDPVTLRTAIKVAGMDWEVVEEAMARDGDRLLDDVRAGADDAGIAEVPAFLGSGPAVAIRLTPAAKEGSARAKLDIIDRMANEDGIWSISKP